MPLAVRRVGGSTPYAQTYTLGHNEAFRLDALSYQIGLQPWGQTATPTIRVSSSSGQTIADMATETQFITNDIGLIVFDFSGPAVLSDDYEFNLPGGRVGYLLHDFGAGIITSHMNVAWPQPPGLDGGVAVTWLRSPGAVSYGAGIGEAVVEFTSTVTITLTAPVPAGDYLLLQLVLITTDELRPDPTPQPTVTGSVGGNVLDFSGHATFGFSVAAVQMPNGLWMNTASEFLRVVNPLAIGDTVTLQLNQGAVPLLQMRAHDVAGLTVGNPIGPNAGGNYIGTATSGHTSPFDLTGTGPVPKWTGAVLINDVSVTAPQGPLEVQGARGLSWFTSPAPITDPTLHLYTQMPLPTLDLGPLDSITVESRDTDGSLRVGDTIHDFLIYGVDE